MAVAIWDHRPDAAALLDARLRLGWSPRESPVGEGPRVLGYAACLLDAGPRPPGDGSLRPLERE